MRRRVALVILVAWVLFLLDITLNRFKLNHPPANLVPFASMAHDIREGGVPFVVNFLGNIVAFMPVGFLLPLALRRRPSTWLVVLTGLALSGTIETGQFLTGRRVADVDDLTLNTAGTFLGALAVSWYGSRDASPTRVAAVSEIVSRDPSHSTGLQLDRVTNVGHDDPNDP